MNILTYLEELNKYEKSMIGHLPLRKRRGIDGNKRSERSFDVFVSNHENHPFCFGILGLL